MRLEDSACESDEGRTGLPDVVTVPLDSVGIWARNPETGASTHAHYDELSEFIVFNCQDVGSSAGGVSKDMYTLLSKNFPWQVIPESKSTRGLVVPKKPTGHGDTAYDVMKSADKCISNEHHVIDIKKAHELLTAGGMRATGELVRLSIGELDPLGYAGSNAAALVHSGYIKRSLRIELAWLAMILFIQNAKRRGNGAGTPREIYEFMANDHSPVRMSRDVHQLATPFTRPYEVMTMWCLAVRHAKEQYGMAPPARPDFGRVIYNKAVRLHLEDVGTLPPSTPKPKRSIPFDSSGKIDEAKIISDWEKDACPKDCRSREEAVSFYEESITFLKLLAQPQVAQSLRADHKELQRMYCDEFPELYHQTIGGGSIESFPAHVVRAWKRMPLPDQGGFVERLRMQVNSHKFMRGALDDNFIRQLSHEIRVGLTSDMYDGWARVFQLKEKEENMPLLKMVIQMSYMMLFLEDAYGDSGDQVYEQRRAITRDATQRLNKVCTTDIISPRATDSGTGIELNPLFL